MMMILGVSPLRGFPVERRGIGHLVPILGGRRLAGLVRLGGGVCPSAGCPVGMVVQLVGPAPTLHGALGGGHTQDMAQPVVPPCPHSRQQVIRGLGGLIAIRPTGDAVQLPRVEAIECCKRSWC